MQKILSAIVFLLLTHSVMGQKNTISGYIRDSESAESLIGANVYEKQSLSGSSSNNYGFYSLTLPAGELELVFSFVGFQTQIIKLNLTADTTINMDLIGSTYLEEIDITADEANPIHESTQMSTIKLPAAQLKMLPSLLGEVDVLKVLQLMPGVQSGSEGSSGLYVRGGGPDQNLILLDGVPVYNAAHLFGFFSVFNADAINNVELIKGGFPARYGGRLSSVIDISMKEGNMKKFQGEMSIGLISSKLTLEAPIVKDKTSFIISGRRTYIDLIASPIVKMATKGQNRTGYYFYDLNTKINHKFSNKDRLYLSAYLGNDKAYDKYKYFSHYLDTRVEYEDKFGLNWGNLTSALRWNHIINNQLFSNTTLTYSRYRFDIFEDSEQVTISPEGTETEYYQSEYFSGIIDWAARIDFDFLPSPNHYIRFGGNATYHTFKPGAYSVKSNVEIDTTIGSEITYSSEFSVYIEDDVKISSALKANIGIHASGFLVNNTFYNSIQPRLALRYLITPTISMKASYAHMTQYIHLLANSGIGLPTDLWVPTTEKIKPQQSKQLALGFAKTLNHGLEISVEGYFKTMENLIEYKEGASFTDLNKDWQDKVEIGDGESYGIEFFLQKKAGEITGWIGYTLSWSNRTFENLNFGKTFPYKYDRRHDIALALMKPWGKKKGKVNEFSFAWVYGTGNSITLPKSTYISGTAPYSSSYNGKPHDYYESLRNYESRNSFRMKAYHRLDVSVSFKKEKKHGMRAWTVGFYNLYSNKNPFFVDIGRDENGNKQFVQYTIFPIIPSIRYSLNF